MESMHRCQMLARLMEAGDWPRLICHWLVNGLPQDVLHTAVSVLKTNEPTFPYYAELADYFSEFDRSVNHRLHPSEELASKCSWPEKLTLALLSFYPKVMLCHLAERTHVTMRDGLLAERLEAARDESPGLGAGAVESPVVPVCFNQQNKSS